MPFTPEELSAAYDSYSAAPSPAAAPAQVGGYTPQQLSDAYDQYQGAQPAPTPAPQSPMQSFAGHLGNVVNDMTLGYGDELIGAGGGLTDYLGGKLGELLGNGQQTPALMDLVDQNYNDIKGAREAYQREYPTFSLLDNVAALKMPVPDVFSKQTGILAALGNTAKGTGLGAAYGGAAGYGSTDGDFTQRLQGALSGAEVGAPTGAMTTGLLEALQGVGGKLAEWAPALNRASIGARQSDYAKTANDLGMIDVPEGDLATRTKSSIDDLLSNGALGDSRDPSNLLRAANSKADDLSFKIGATIKAYDNAGGAPVNPTFENALNYLQQGKVPADKIDSYLKRLGDLQSKINSEGQGSLEYLQQQKIAHGALWDPNDSALNGFNRAIYTDLQKTIESAVPEVGPLNAELQKVKIVKPILQRGMAESEAANPGKAALQFLRTSGGFGVPILAGAKMGGLPGAVIGAALGAAGKAASSRRGMALESALMSSLGPKMAALGTGAALTALPALALAENSSAPSAPIRPLLPGGMGGSNTPKPTTQQAQKVLNQALLSSSPNPTNMAPLINSNLASPDLLSAQRVSGKAAKADTNLDTLAAAVQSQESKGDAKAVSSKGARGLMQIMPDTAKDIAKELGVKNYDLEDPKTNQLFGRYYLSKMLDQYDGDPQLALAAYNMGPGALNKVIKRIGSSDWPKISRYLQDEGIYSETRKYVPAVLKRLNSVEA